MRLTIKISFAPSTSEQCHSKEQGMKSSTVKGKEMVSNPDRKHSSIITRGMLAEIHELSTSDKR